MANDPQALIVDGKEVPLTRFDRLALVAPARDQHPAAVAARLAKSSRLALDPRFPGWALVVWGESAKLQEIQSYADVRHTRAAFTDTRGQVLVLSDDLLVRFEDGTSEEERQRIADGIDGAVIRRDGGVWTIKLFDPRDDAPLTVARQLSAEPAVRYAEPDALQALTFLHAPASEPRFPNQWHLRNTGQNGGASGADVDAMGAWAITQGSPSIAVVVHDSGVDIAHPDLAPNILPGWDFDNNDGDASNDSGPHGSACAGIIGAASNGSGIAGMAPGCRIVPLRAAGAHPYSTWAHTFDWARARGQIISCSWSITPNNTLSDAIRRAVAGGVTVICAAGNDPTAPVAYPASMAETIAVGASTNRDRRAWYSASGSELDVVAPSGGGTLGIETTDVRGANGYNRTDSPDGDYCVANGPSGFSGTSAATPLVAGVAALMLSARPGLSPEDVKRVLRSTAEKIDPAGGGYGPSGHSLMYGYGRVNAARAVANAKPLYASIYAQGDPGHGIAGYDLASTSDIAFAYDYDSSGKTDHLVLCRPGKGACFVVKRSSGAFSAVYAQGDPGHGIGGYDLRGADRGFAFDYNSSGRADHLVLYRPGKGACFIIARNGGTFAPVYAQPDPGAGIGGYDLRGASDLGFAYDYNSSGRADHLVFYRPGRGACFIMKRSGAGFTPVYAQPDPGSGIGGYDLRGTTDKGFAFDYDGSGKADHLVFYRPGRGAIFILRRHTNGTFSPVYAQSDPGGGIGGYDLLSPDDQAFALDFNRTGKLDHLVLYRPGKGAIFILENRAGTFRPVYAQVDPGRGIAGYDLASPHDRAFAVDASGTGTLSDIVLYRPGKGAVFVLRRQ